MTRMTRCDDGKYRWCYRMDLFKRPRVLKTLLKAEAVLTFIAYCIFVYLFAMVRDTSTLGPKDLGYGFLIIYCAAGLVTALLYYLITALTGNIRLLVFEMNEDGIRFFKYMVPSKVKKELPDPDMTVSYNSALAYISKCRKAFESYEDFGKIAKVIIRRATDEILLRSPFYRFNIFIYMDDLDTVDSFIRDHSERLMFQERHQSDY